MIYKRIPGIALVAISLFFSQLATAADPAEKANHTQKLAPSPQIPGPYIGVHLGRSAYDFQLSVKGGSHEDTAVGFKLVGGYRFNQYLALEIAYIDFGEASLRINSGGTLIDDGVRVTNTLPSPIDVTYKAETVGWGLVAGYPLNGFYPYVKVGSHSWDTKTHARVISSSARAEGEDDGRDLFWGLGLRRSVPTIRHLSVGVEFERYAFDDLVNNGSVSLLSLGITYQF